MFSDFFKKIDKSNYSLQFSILAIFIVLFVITAALLIAITSYRFEKTLTYTSFELMDRISLAALEEANTVFGPAEQQSKFTAHLIQKNVINLNNDEIINYSYHLVELWPYVDVARWGDANGNFVITDQHRNKTITTTQQNNHQKPPLTIINRDKQGNMTSTQLLPQISYDPRTRPWYIKAKIAEHTIWTELYIYPTTHSVVITSATPVYQNNHLLGVFGLDIKLNTLIEFIKNQIVSAHGYSFIVTNTGLLIASPKLNFTHPAQENKINLPNLHDIGMPSLAQSLDEYNKNHLQNFTMKFNGIIYYVSYRPIPILTDEQWLIGVVIPKGDFTKVLEKLHLITLIISSLMLCLGILLLKFFTNKITQPIKSLVKETNKIKQLDFREGIKIESRIREVILLTEAMRAMKKGLRSFQKYVPKILVKQLIETHEDSHIGGTRKSLVVFFSDIKDFTYISEALDPDDLMLQMTQYFEALSKIIITYRGTIDKYIGDSIMAFWGAPISDNESAIGAAQAAVYCQRQINLLNEEWQKSHKPTLITRMGIHVGDAIVGNIGSSERLNYTAIGDAINMTSRLEGINKIYGTKIMVSDTMYQLIKNQFYLRLVDRVAMRGRRDSNYIYELLEEDSARILFNLNAYREIYHQGFSAYQQQQWNEAIRYFNQCLEVYPDDTVTPVMITRCQIFKKEPAKTDWDGIWRIT